MAKSKSRVSFLCRVCGSVQSQWMGKCPDCNTWDALERYVEPKMTEDDRHVPVGAVAGWSIGSDGEAGGASSELPRAAPLPEIEAAEIDRWSTGIGEFDRVLGGGIVPGSVILLGGDPGIGKSTLLLQAAASMAAGGARILYMSSEESAYQTRLRAERVLGLEAGTASRRSKDTQGQPEGQSQGQSQSLEAFSDLYLLADTNLARMIEQARQVQPRVLIVDSIQMIYKHDLDASPGSVTQLRRCCMELVYVAKRSGMAVILVGHVTKEGHLAGPKLLEHLVDTVLSFEGDRHHAHRIVRAVKNRFGTTLEVAIFEMSGHGLQELQDGMSVLDPAAQPAPGSVICPVMHGSRCLLVEIQALTATGFLGSARRKTSGIDANRLAMLIAVLEKRGGLRLADQDVFTSAVGGLKVQEPAADLALALAIAGAHYNRALDHGVAAVGEVGLGGEIRRVAHAEQRVREAVRLGFTQLIGPAELAGVMPPEATLLAAPSLGRAMEHLSAAADPVVRQG